MHLPIEPDMLKQYVLYKITDEAGEVLSLGITPFKQLTGNIKCDDVCYLTVVQRGNDISVLANIALEMFPDRADEIGETITEVTSGLGRAVKCNESGEIFKSMADAARTHGLSYSALVKHLNGEIGYISVKGRTYKRIKR